ncbi:hypothetical protein C8R45DRAFT_1107412 [Mycena sanguinolenta]|nr:hypothetical protein C8R45DRAFT_1107412 [Mycena sanguinolenta]
MVAPTCFLQAVVLIVNYQGNVLHLANDISPTARPIVTMPCAVPTIPNEMWDFIPLDDTHFIVESSQQTQPSGIFLGAQMPTTPFVQASGVRSPAAFTLQCINSTAGAIMETSSGLALTAWSSVGNDFSAPVTYEKYIGPPNQIWNFVAA